jgi:hypothetical protein
MSTLDPRDLVAGVDIADELGVTPGAVGNWRARHEDFPRPVVTVARGTLPIYSRRAVLAWANNRRNGERS